MTQNDSFSFKYWLRSALISFSTVNALKKVEYNIRNLKNNKTEKILKTFFVNQVSISCGKALRERGAKGFLLPKAQVGLDMKDLSR